MEIKKEDGLLSEVEKEIGEFVDKELKKPSKFFKILKNTMLFFVFMLSFISIFFSITPSRQFALKIALDVLNAGLQGEILVKDVKFASLSNIYLEDIIIIANKDTVLDAKRINIKFRFLKLFNNEVIVDKLVLNNTKVNLQRNKDDSTWNFEHIVYPSLDTTTTQVPDIKINVFHLEFINSQLKLSDNVNKELHTSLNLSNFNLQKLNIDLSAYAEIRNNIYRANIHKLSFVDEISKFSLINSKLSAALDPNSLKLSNLIVNTNSFQVLGKISLNNFDVFGIDTLKSINYANLSADLSTKQFTPIEFFDIISLKDLKIGGVLDLNIKAKGKLNDLVVEKFTIKSSETSLALSGHFWDLLDDNPKYELVTDESSVSNSDIYEIIGYLPKDKMPIFKHIDISDLHILGDTKAVKTQFNFDTKQGKLKGKFDYNFFSEDFDCDVNFNQLNLSSFFNKKVLLSDLSGQITAKGKSFDIQKSKFDVDLTINNSKFQEVNIGRLGLIANSIGNGKINIVNLKYSRKFTELTKTLTTDSTNSTNSTNILANSSDNSANNNIAVVFKPEFEMNGYLDVIDTDGNDFSTKHKLAPIYNLNFVLNEFDLSKLLANKDLPTSISGRGKIEGNGVDLDKIKINLNNQIDYLSFGDRAFLPFNLDLDIDNSTDLKKMNLSSDFLNLQLSGEYNFSELFELAHNQNLVLANFINDKLNNILPKLDSASNFGIFPINQVNKFPNIDCLIDIKVKDISILSAFVDNLYLKTQFETKLSIKSDSTVTQVQISDFQMPTMRLGYKGSRLRLQDFNFSAEFGTKLQEGITQFNYLRVGLNSSQPIIFDKKQYAITKFETSFRDDDFDFNFDLTYDSLINLKASGFGLITGEEKNELNFEIGDFLLSIGDSLFWRNTEKILFTNIYNSFDFYNFKLQGKNTDKFFISGLIDFQNRVSKNLSLQIETLQLDDIFSLLEAFNKEDIEEESVEKSTNDKNAEKQAAENNIKGLIKSFNIAVNGSFDNPLIKVKSEIDDIIINKESFGNLTAELFHSQGIISGNIDIFSKKNGTNIDIEVKKLPILLSIDGKKFDERVNQKEELKVDIDVDKLALKTVENYAPAISDLNGFGYLKLNLGGYLSNNIDYNGKAKFEDVDFLVDATNIRYKANGEASLKKGLVNLDKVLVHNYEQDLTNGLAKVTGTISLKGVDIDYLDIIVNTKNLLVLNQKAKKTLRWIYGDLRIATGKEPLRFFGTLKKPSLTGDVDVLFGDLVMPQEDVSQIVKSKFNYIVKGSEKDITNEVIFIDKEKFNKKWDNRKKQENLSLDSLKKAQEELKKQQEEELIEKENGDNVINRNKRFSDIINYDLNLRIPGIFKVNMVINAAIELFAELSNKDLNKPLHYIKNRDEKDAKLFGDMVVKDNSRLSFFKSFKTSGYLYFTSGNLLNPNLDLVANYRGRTTGSNSKDFLVDIKIGGTKEEPIINYSYILGSTQSAGDQSQVLQNVFYLLTLGNLKSQGDGSGDFSLNKSTSDFANSMLAGMATKQLNQVLAKSGLNAEINFDSGDIEQAKIKLSGQVFNFAQLSYGGKLSDINSANEIQLSVPFSALFTSTFLKDMVLQASYINTLNTIQTQDQKIWEMKLKIGGSR